jgi:hypothetical protein
VLCVHIGDARVVHRVGTRQEKDWDRDGSKVRKALERLDASHLTAMRCQETLCIMLLSDGLPDPV